MQTRRRRCAQVIAARRSASVRGSFSGGRDARWPRLAGVTCARSALFGANTPYFLDVQVHRVARGHA